MRGSPKSAVAFVALALLLAAPPASRAAALSQAARPAAALADPILKEPYLIFPGDPSRMEVLWQLSTTAVSTLAWGPDTSCALGSVPSPEYGDHQHAYTIGGLVPGTRYWYRVTTDGFAHGGSFTAMPLPGAPGLKFLAYGDTRTYPAIHDQVAAAMLGTIAADSAYRSLVLMCGDFVYYGNNETYWTNEFFSSAYRNIRGFMAAIPYQACMGNHENFTPVLFEKYFPFPFVAGRYWSFDAGPAHVLVVDQYSAYGPGSAQLQWIANDLAATNRTWKIVLLHEPGWSSGPSHGNNPSVQLYLEPLFEQYGVSIVFGGHNHNYARAVVNGVQHITTGGGGAPIDYPWPGYPNIVASAGANHFCRVAIDGPFLTFAAVTPEGAVLDSFALDKSGPEAVPPTVTLLAPLGGERWRAGIPRTISWSARDNVGVSAVDLDLSLSGPDGPWTPIAHGFPNSGSYAWTVPTQLGDSAFVRVTARDFAGNQAQALGDSAFHIIDPSLGVGPSSRGGDIELSRPSPNPGRGTVRLAYRLGQECIARIEVLDLSGRRLWSAGGRESAGPHEVLWDGRAGRQEVEAGLYFVRLVTPRGTRTQRLVLLR